MPTFDVVPSLFYFLSLFSLALCYGCFLYVLLLWVYLFFGFCFVGWTKKNKNKKMSRSVAHVKGRTDGYLSGILNSMYSSGEVLGPLIGTGLTQAIGFPAACFWVGVLLFVCMQSLWLISNGKKKKKWHLFLKWM